MLMTAPASDFPEFLIITYLEMTDATLFMPAFIQRDGVEIRRLTTPDVPLYRRLYDGVGDALFWRDRRLMSDADLLAAITRPEVSIYVLYVDGVVSGYFELERQGDDTEIAYFGLFPGSMGAGLGKHLLSAAIDQAWKDGAKRVYVHTCNLDSPAALPNYIKRGFEVYDVQRQLMPDRYKT
ncbi:MAG: GNAT family N-acetyltransferase [Anaerolineae bacterium]|nr:GNAT family N-acetyltransferase [Chloroflexota bacterium]MBN8634371.1 GNAT family N-acetyltransferase [Anaerolineae bacterium]